MSAYILVAIVNVVALLVFGAVAIHFNYWWIMLFAPLCMLSIKHKEVSDE